MNVAELQGRLDAVREKSGAPGASVAVLHDGLVTAAASGVLNLVTGVEATTDSLFQIGSITKTYTATMVMQLIEQNQLALETRIVDVLPEFSVADAAVTKQITVRHLLTHTAGFDGDLFEDFGRGDDALEKYTAACSSLSQTTPIGAIFSYNNAAFSVLGRVIEVVTGQVWDAALRERVFAPLALSHSVTLPEEALRFRAAIGHLGSELAPQWGLPRGVGPAGLICATASDVVAFAQAHLSDSPVLSQESARAMREPQVGIPGPPGGLLPQQQGLGWMLADFGGVQVVCHDGGTIGQSARLRMVPATGTAVAMLGNGGDFLTLCGLVDELLAEFAGAAAPAELHPHPEVPECDLASYVGRFQRLNQAVTVELKDGVLIGTHEMSQGGVVPLSFSSELVPYDPTSGVFLTRLEHLTAGWLTVVFVELEDGSRVFHMGGRATPELAHA